MKKLHEEQGDRTYLITKKITVPVEKNELVGLLIDALYPKAKNSESQEQTFFRAFSNLIGCTDIEAVKIANKWADEHDAPRITTEKFRRWLPRILSQTFADFLG